MTGLHRSEEWADKRERERTGGFSFFCLRKSVVIGEIVFLSSKETYWMRFLGSF